MADNYNDEYEFADLDEINTDPQKLDPVDAGTFQEPAPSPNNGNNIRRNALIVIGLVLLATLAYKFFGSFYGSSIPKKQETVDTPTVTPQPAPTPSLQPVQTTPATPPVTTSTTTSTTTPATTPDQSRVEQQFSALELGQQNLRSEISSQNDQLSAINASVNELSNKIATQNQIISSLSAKIDEQAQQLSMLEKRATTVRSVHAPIIRHKVIAVTTYYIQAVIPGRAWLISSKGSTLTVREGSIIPGYGVVKLIDPNQGRVITSSGRIIRFSQQDS